MRVHLVEDENLVAMLVEDMITDLGCTVAAHAGSLPEALEEARAGGFEVAPLDVEPRWQESLPGCRGPVGAGIPFAFASGYGRAGLPEAFRTRPVLPEPFQMEELSAALADALLGSKGGPSTLSAELHKQRR
jgi:CheY-like chemotaxis protein